MGMGRDALNGENNKYATSLQYLKKEVSDEVEFQNAGKHQNFLQVDTIFLMGLARHAENTKTSLQYLYDISRKKLGMKLIFGMQIIKLCHGNNRFHMSIKHYCKRLFLL